MKDSALSVSLMKAK